eukprot:scaffold30_cov416-Prasinococcus_capsulatus_cf.AAC.24
MERGGASRQWCCFAVARAARKLERHQGSSVLHTWAWLTYPSQPLAWRGVRQACSPFSPKTATFPLHEPDALLWTVRCTRGRARAADGSDLRGRWSATVARLTHSVLPADQGIPYRAGAEVAQLPHDDMGVVAAEDGEAVSPFRSGNSAGLPDSSEVPATSGQPAPPGAAANDGGSRGDGEGASLGGRQGSVAEDRAGPAEGTTGPPDSTSSITGALARTSLSPLVVPSNSELPGSMLHSAAPALGSPLKKGLQGSPRRGALGLPQSSAPVRTLSGLSSHELHAASYASTRPSVTVVRAMSGGLEQRIPILSRLPTKDFGAHPLFCNKLRHTRLVCKVRGVSNSSAALVSNWRMKSKVGIDLRRTVADVSKAVRVVSNAT